MDAPKTAAPSRRELSSRAACATPHVCSTCRREGAAAAWLCARGFAAESAVTGARHRRTGAESVRHALAARALQRSTPDARTAPTCSALCGVCRSVSAEMRNACVRELRAAPRRALAAAHPMQMQQVSSKECSGLCRAAACALAIACTLPGRAPARCNLGQTGPEIPHAQADTRHANRASRSQIGRLLVLTGLDAAVRPRWRHCAPFGRWRDSFQTTA